MAGGAEPFQPGLLKPRVISCGVPGGHSTMADTVHATGAVPGPLPAARAPFKAP